MPNIPTIPGVSPISQESAGVKINPGPTLNAIGAAKGAINAAGQSIEEIAGSLVDYEKRKQKSEEAYFFNKTFINLDKTTSTFARQMKGMNDQQIVPTWQGVAQQAQAGIKDDPEYQQMSKPAQDRLQLHLSRWQADSTSGFQQDADVRASTRRWSTALAAMNQSLNTDPTNLDRATAILKAQKADAPPGQYDHMVSQLPAMAEVHQIITGSDTNPPKTLKALEDGQFSHLDPTQYKEWHTFLKGTVSEYYANNTQNLYGQADPKTGIIPEEAIKAADIPAKTKKTMIAAQARETYAADDGNRKSLMYRVGNPDEWKSDPKGAKADFIAEAGNIKNVDIRNRAVAEINRVADSYQKHGHSDDPPDLRDALDQIRRESQAEIGSREILDRRNGKFVLSDDAVRKTYGDFTDRVTLAESNKVTAANQYNQLRDWYHAYPASHKGAFPSTEEVSTERQKILAPEIERRTKASLAGGNYVVGAVYTDKTTKEKARWTGTGWEAVK